MGSFLNNHVVTYIEGVKISTKKVINYLTAAKLIPVSQTTAYKVDHLCSLGCITENASWTDLSKHGRKALLTPQETMWLILNIRSDTRGGESMGVSEMKDRLRKHIVQVWTKNKKLHLLPYEIPERSIMALVNKIKSQCVFSLYNNVNNKSESRVTAEWSMRSTLAYTAIVAVNHF